MRGGPEDVARAVVCIQAQAPTAAELSLRVRGGDFTVSDVRDALAAGRLVRTWLLRGTLHTCAAEDVRWLLSIVGPLGEARGRTRRAALGLDPKTCERGLEVIGEALQDGPLTRAEIFLRLMAKRVRVAADGHALPHLMYLAANRGLICCAPPRGGRDTYALLDQVVPARRGDLRGEHALAELARRYMEAYAPATAHDLAVWSGVPIGTARRALEVSREGGEAGRPSRAPISRAGGRREVRLLPAFDTYLLGYKSRGFMVDQQGLAAIQRGGGWLHPTVAIDGWLSGSWRLARRGRRMEVEVTPFAKLPAGAAGGLEAEVADIGRFLEAPATLRILG